MTELRRRMIEELRLMKQGGAGTRFHVKLSVGAIKTSRSRGRYL